jgi:cation:H+ antiporter
MVIGLTVVAFGTSAPELAVSIAAAWKGNAEIALGNVVGSNIFNVLFILGLSACFAPLVVQRSFLRRELPIMIGASLSVWIFGLDGRIGPLEGGFLLAAAVGFTWWLVREGRNAPPAANLDAVTNVPLRPAVLPLVAGIGFSLVLLVAGSKLLVAGAVAVAQSFGVSELVIGLTIVAAGTSLPEVAASVAATLRGERDIAIGNVVGSNIFNILAVLGGSSLLAPAGMPVSPVAMGFDIPVMMAVALLCLPVFMSGGQVSRLEGVLFLALYGGYTALLVFTSRQPDFDRMGLLVGSIGLIGLVVAWEFIRARSRTNRST